MKSRVLVCAVASSITAFSAAYAQKIVPDTNLDAEIGALQARYGVRVFRSDEVGLAAFGAVMNTAPSAAEAAAQWIADNAPALGADAAELRLIGSRQIGSGSLTVLVYEQVIDGLRVENSVARVGVRQAGRDNRVVYAAASLVARPAAGFARDTIDGPAAVAMVRAGKAYGHLQLWSAPELVIFSGDRVGTVRAWKFSASEPLPAAGEAYTFFVSAAAGRLLEARDEIYDAVFGGRIFGFGTPGTLPDTPANPPQLRGLAGLTVHTAAGDLFATDALGQFSFDVPAAGPLDLTVTPAGEFASALNGGGPTLFRTVPAFPGFDVEFVLNQQVNEFTVAQINGFVHATRTHDFYASRQPGYTGIDDQITVAVNLSGQCNAFFNTVTRSINTFRAGLCVNMAYSSVIAHEYGHYIVDRLGLRQGSFGEGFGDALAMLVYDDPVIGRDFAGPGTFVRDLSTDAEQYPCCCQVHDCGQVLGGVWWGINVGLQDALGAEEGLAVARQLFTDWSQLTIGVRRGYNSATPLTAIEVLTADDDDGVLENGTPHRAEICEAFAAHGIACPGGCEQVEELTAECRRGRVRATVSGPSGIVVSLTLDGEDAKSVTLSARGRGAATWRGEPGEHEVCLEGCDVCTAVACE